MGDGVNRMRHAKHAHRHNIFRNARILTGLTVLANCIETKLVFHSIVLYLYIYRALIAAHIIKKTQ